jgi:hypothetical protein
VFVTVCSHPIPAVRFVGIFVGIVLVSEEQTFTATFAIPNEGIEQMQERWRVRQRLDGILYRRNLLLL